MSQIAHSIIIRSTISKLQFNDGLLNISIAIFYLLIFLIQANTLYFILQIFYLLILLPKYWVLLRAIIVSPRIGYGSITMRSVCYSIPISIFCFVLTGGVFTAALYSGSPEAWASSWLYKGFQGYLLAICTFMAGACWALPRFMAYAFLLGSGTWFLTMALPVPPHNWALAATGMAMLATGWHKWKRFTRTGPTPIPETASPAGEWIAEKPQLNDADRRLLLRVLSHVEAANVPFLAKVTGLNAETVNHHLSLLAQAGCICTLPQHAACALSPTATLTEKGLQHLRSLGHP